VARLGFVLVRLPNEKNRYFPRFNVLLFFSIIFYSPSVYSQDAKLSGCIEGDCRQGFGTYIYSYSTKSRYKPDDKYVGEWENGHPNGQGTKTYENGDKYVGEWEEGK